MTNGGVVTISGGSSGGGGVTSLNSLTGVVSITGGGQVSVTTSGSTISVSTSGVSSILNMVNEIPFGVVNGINPTFTLSQTPISGSTQIFMNGTYMAPSGSTYNGYDYRVSGQTITFQTAPMSNSIIYAAYITTTYNNFAYNEIPAGIIDGNNNVFTLLHAPITNSTQVFLNGTFMARFVSPTIAYDYTISTNNVVFETAPPSGSILFVNYTF